MTQRSFVSSFFFPLHILLETVLLRFFANHPDILVINLKFKSRHIFVLFMPTHKLMSTSLSLLSFNIYSTMPERLGLCMDYFSAMLLENICPYSLFLSGVLHRMVNKTNPFNWVLNIIQRPH